MFFALLAALLTQAPVTLPQLTGQHCSSSGWCAVLPAPLYPGLVAARGDTVVTHGVRSGVVMLGRAGAWRDTLDTGLGPLRRLMLTDAPGGALWLFACDSVRCVRAKVDDRFGALALVPDSELPVIPPEPEAREPRPGARFFLEEQRLTVESGGQRRTPPAVEGTQFAKELDVLFGGGPGEPLWLYRAYETARLTVTREHPLGKLERFFLARCPHGVTLLGAPERPFAVCDELGTHSLHRFNGERWQALTTELEWASPDLGFVQVGGGCAPCFLSSKRLLWRAQGGSWRTVDLPALASTAQEGHHHPERASIDARGLPEVVSQHGTWRHDGAHWRRVGRPSETAPSVEASLQAREQCNATGCLRAGDAHWSPDGKSWQPLRLPLAEPGTELALAQEDKDFVRYGQGKDSDCAAALEGGEFAFVFNAMLVRGTPEKGWRTERLPMGYACHFTEGPEGLYLWNPFLKILMFQRKDAAPMPVPDETWATVSGVKARDVLRVREVPDWRSLEVATLAPGTSCVRELRRRTVARETWAEVLTEEGKRGWVNRRFLARARGPCSPQGGSARPP
ncbi:SH3 domain-containing protein [Corallococcus sp. BB11-1]|uniref:SH3 domain-containing protein n=1 Tax=Corallococcus sp. BB11-1 TaxID=2996783 RepID=UPI002270B2C8|nr:SH3 domain-containing protein [Corallococcus sp. BB11-1]MCY1030296.1 SH3 domain-containing protein [Corallococcus sp. BB11-1]